MEYCLADAAAHSRQQVPIAGAQFIEAGRLDWKDLEAGWFSAFREKNRLGK